MIFTPIKLITANVGDSRIILGKYNEEKNTWISADLTRDHKPSLPDEEKRILSKGGRIEPMKDEDWRFCADLGLYYLVNYSKHTMYIKTKVAR